MPLQAGWRLKRQRSRGGGLRQISRSCRSMKIGSLLGALLAKILASPSMAACYGRTGAQPQTRFVLRGGEALDSKTDLVWQRCSLGMTWDGKRGCHGERMSAGTPLPTTIKDARALADEL